MPTKPTMLALFAALSTAALAAPATPALAGDQAAAATLSEAYVRIQKDYVDEVDPATLQEHSIRGMVEALDPHSKYLDATQYQALRASNRGQYGGLGVRIRIEGGRVRVISPMPGTPAERAGLRAGDWVVGLDGRELAAVDMSEVRDLMRGAPGTPVELTVMRDGQSAPLTLTLERAVIESHSVESRLLERGLGYIRISRFQSRSDEDVVAALQELREAAGGRLSGLVLDLRNNPGGLVSSSVHIADVFLREGTIVSTKGRRKGDRSWSAKADDLLEDAPLVVLVNERSASASEIVAGALQDHGRAIVLGNKTYGKGTVQSILPLADGTALKLTTARYYTPSGRSIHKLGITPDVVLGDEATEAAEPQARPVAYEPPLDGLASVAPVEDRALGAAVKLLLEAKSARTPADVRYAADGGGA